MSLKPSLHQAAGHGLCLTMDDGLLFVKPTTSQEVDFYTQTQFLVSQDQSIDETSSASKLTDWMPACMGVLTQGDLTNFEGKSEILSDKDKEFIVLQNLYDGFSKPSVMDIKLGSQLVDEETTTPEKIARLKKVAESTTSGSLNFRICGMKVLGDEVPENIFENMNETVTIDSGYLVFNKIFGRSLTKDNVEQGIHTFFSNFKADHIKNPKIKHLIIIRLLRVFLGRLHLIYNCLTNYELRIFSGSLLFIFESDIDRWVQDETLNENNLLINDAVYEVHDPLVRKPFLEDDDDDDDENEEEDDEEQGEVQDKNINDIVGMNQDKVQDTQIGEDILDEEEEQKAPLSALNLIDFAHSKHTPGQGIDENILIGIRNLTEIFEVLLKQEKDLLSRI